LAGLINAGRWIDLLHKMNIETQLAKPKDVTEMRPGISAIKRLIRNWSTDENRIH
jgi:hypothetical protein